LIGSRRCVECLSNDHCGNLKPFCDTSTYRCEACLTNMHCRSQEDCNGLCNVTVPGDHHCYNINSTVMNCTVADQLCYRYEGECYDRCFNNSQCHTLFTDKVYCRLADQRCVGCLNDDQCGISLNETCGNQCSYIQSQDQTLCSGGSSCSGGSPYCTHFATGYRCSHASTLNAKLLTVLILICMMIFLL
jgi:hypothetical protein